MRRYIERVYFNTKLIDYIYIVVLLPFSFIYGLVNLIKAKLAKRKINYGLPIISIGNIIIGGSGKTPFCIELINHIYNKRKINVAYISRGYGRVSKGFITVKKDDKILVNVIDSGDEAMLVAKKTKCNVYVSENRETAIIKAKKDGAEVIILDDAFSKLNIDKLDILLEPKDVTNRFTLPSGPYREFEFSKIRADIIAKEGRDFKRLIFYEDLTDRMMLVTSISNPTRLNKTLPNDIVDKIYYKDHEYFDIDHISKKVNKIYGKSILVTEKDYVKLENYKSPISIMKLHLQIDSELLKKIDKYIGGKS